MQMVSPEKPDTPPVAVSEEEPRLGEHSSRALTVKVGQTFIVSLPQNTASTGYSWTLAEPPGAIRVLGETTIPPTGTTGIVGASGDVEWRLLAEKTGTQPLVFSYRRPWEDADIDRTIEFEITVTE